MELLQLEYFLRAAETENFSAVARMYYVPPSSVSKSVSLLERELQTPLFTRRKNRLLLNAAGRAFMPYAAQALQSLQTGTQRARAAASENELSLLVLCARRTVTDFLRVFLETHPQTAFKINHNGDADMRRYDFCICAKADAPADFDCVPLFSEAYGIAANPAHFPLSPPVRLADLKDTPFILMPPGATLTRDCTRFCAAHGFTPTANIVLEDPFYVRSYTALGLGVSFFPAKSWAGLFPDSVQLFPLADDSIRREVVLCRSRDAAAPLQTDFAAALRDFVRGM